MLCQQDWKGNIRQLRNVAEQMSILEKERNLKRLKKKPRKKAAKKQKEVEEEKPQKIVSSPVLPSTSFSFSGSRLPTFLIAGFVLGFITFAIIGSSSSSDPYGCTQCDVFAPDYDGPPPIEMDLWVPDDYYYDDYYYDDYYDGGYYPWGGNNAFKFLDIHAQSQRFCKFVVCVATRRIVF